MQHNNMSDTRDVKHKAHDMSNLKATQDMSNLKAGPSVMWIQHELSEALLTGMMNLKASRSLHSPLGNWIFK